MRSKYIYDFDVKEIAIKDLDGGKSVTNDIENVINDIIQDKGYNFVIKRRIISQDSFGEWCEIKPVFDCIQKKCINVRFKNIQL